MASSDLLSLPEELLAEIASYLHAGSIFPFALTCKATYHHVDEALERHRGYHDTYSVSHDRLPLTVPTLLRLAINDPQVGWHIRALDFWGARPSFQKWKTWSFYHPYGLDDPDDWPEPSEDHSMLDQSFYTDDELDTFARLMIMELHLSAEDTEEWMSKLREGWDEPLKGLLMALSPKLDRVNFVAYDSWQSSTHHDTHPLTMLCGAISRIYHLPDATWPAGFASLRKVDVCTTTELRHPHDVSYNIPTSNWWLQPLTLETYCCKPSEIAPLFLLPNIKILNLTLLDYSEDPDPDFYLPPHSSSVTSLGFYCCDLSDDVLERLIRAPRSLSHLSMDYSTQGGLDKVLSECLADTIRSLDCVEMDPGRLRMFHNLEEVCGVNVTDTNSSIGTYNGRSHSSVRHRVRTTNDEDIGFADLRELLPPSVQKVKLIVGRSLMRCIDRTNIALVKSRLMSTIADLVDDARFAGLHEVCVYDVFSDKDRAGDLTLDQVLLSRIEAKGVELHLRTRDGQELGYEAHKALHQPNTGLGLVETTPEAEQNGVD